MPVLKTGVPNVGYEPLVLSSLLIVGCYAGARVYGDTVLVFPTHFIVVFLVCEGIALVVFSFGFVFFPEEIVPYVGVDSVCLWWVNLRFSYHNHELDSKSF